MIFATGNMGKLKEIKDILGDIGEEIISMKEAGIDVDIEALCSIPDDEAQRLLCADVTAVKHSSCSILFCLNFTVTQVIECFCIGTRFVFDCHNFHP